jgi:hypothetical protein
LPRDRRPNRHAGPNQTTGTGRADDERVARRVDGHERRGLVADRLMGGLEDEIEELVGARGVPDAQRRALETAEQGGGGQLAGCSTRPFRTA